VFIRIIAVIVEFLRSVPIADVSEVKIRSRNFLNPYPPVAGIVSALLSTRGMLIRLNSCGLSEPSALAQWHLL
jgi:hypothetical protein